MRSFRVKIGGNAYLVEVGDSRQSPVQVRVNGQPYVVEVEWHGAAAEATVSPEVVTSSVSDEPMPRFTDLPPLPPTPQLSAVERSAAPTIEAPMPGTILETAVKPGEQVVRGQEVCVLEAMKMRNSIKSPRDGRISEVLVAPGQKVAFGTVLVRFESQVD